MLELVMQNRMSSLPALYILKCWICITIVNAEPPRSKE